METVSKWPSVQARKLSTDNRFVVQTPARKPLRDLEAGTGKKV